MAKYQKGKLYTLAVTDITTDPDQPRKYMDPDAQAELAASIARHGVLEPLLFRVDEAGTPILVAGERRLAAARQAGLTTVPAIFVTGNHAEISLVENLLRENLTPVEEAEALNKIMKDHGYTQESLAGVIGKARSTVTEILSLNRLPQEIRDECRGNKTVTRSALIEIARKKQSRGMVTAWQKYKEKSQKPDSGTRPGRPTIRENATTSTKPITPGPPPVFRTHPGFRTAGSTRSSPVTPTARSMKTCP